MSAPEPRLDVESRTSRRDVVATGVKLAYATPLVAASFALTGEGTLATACTCQAGTYAIPDHIINTLKQWGLYPLANRLQGKCVGCSSGPLTIPSTGLTTVCLNIGRALKTACPGKYNYITLTDPPCVSG